MNVVSVSIGAIVLIAFLRLRGQPWLPRTERVKVWEGNIHSPGCSQHVSDWYSLSHVNHGVAVGVIAILLGWSFDLALVVALATGVAWEIIEHTDYVLNRFRTTTISLGYRGDTVVNSVSDYVLMTVGFWVAWQLPLEHILSLMVVLEVTAIVAARDSLLLATVMLCVNSDRIRRWQLREE